MTRGMIKALAGAGAAALLLAACSSGDDGNGGDNDTGGTSDPVAEEMRSWDGCEVLGNLQPVVDFIGIEEWAGTSDPTTPTTYGWNENNLDSEALGCAGGIDLEAPEGSPASGEIRVNIVPMEDDEAATASYDQRAEILEGRGGDVESFRTDLADPWDAGVLVASTNEAGSTEYVNAVARDGQWVLDFYLTFTADYNAQNGGEPDYKFTNEELQQWLTETYLPEVNQAVSDRI